MLIDPFTTIAQIVNFLILVALLKRFLYHPIMQAMEKRENKIALRFQEAEDREKLAQQEINQYQQKQQEWEELKSKRFQQLEEEVAGYRESLIEQVKTATENKKRQWQEVLQQQQQKFMLELRQRTSEQLIKITRQVLTDLATVSLEEQIILKFQEKLENFNWNVVEPSHFVIRSTFPISSTYQSQLYKTIQSYFSQKIELTFEQSSQEICGIELRSSSHKIRWNIDQYLDELEAEIKRSLTVRAGEDK